MLTTLDHYRFFGYWLGNGYVESLTFKTIDFDVMEWFKKFKGFVQILNNQNKYVFKINNKSLHNFFIQQTNYKSNLPKNMNKWNIQQKQEFLGGFLDAEGFVSVNERENQPTRYLIGFCTIDKWAKDIVFLLEKLGCKAWKYQKATKSNKDAHRYISNISNFLQSGIKFITKRKQSRIDQYKKDKKIENIPYKASIQNNKCLLCNEFVEDIMIHLKRTHSLSRKEYNILFPQSTVSYKKWKGKGIRKDIGNGDVLFYSKIEANIARILEYCKIKYSYLTKAFNVSKLGKYAVPFFLEDYNLSVFINFTDKKTQRKNNLFSRRCKVKKTNVGRKEYSILNNCFKNKITLETVDLLDLLDVEYSENNKFLNLLLEQKDIPSQT